MKQVKCSLKSCRKLYTKFSITHRACSPECAIELTKESKAKKARQQHQDDKLRLKTRAEWMREAQAAFNSFIRERDVNQPCICCGLPLIVGSVGGGYDCGHYRSVGSAPHLRFNPDNAHGQRKQCNRWGSGRAVDYRLGLINRIGLKRVEALESDQEIRKYSIEQLQAIKAEYKEKLKHLKK